MWGVISPRKATGPATPTAAPAISTTETEPRKRVSPTFWPSPFATSSPSASTFSRGARNAAIRRPASIHGAAVCTSPHSA